MRLLLIRPDFPFELSAELPAPTADFLDKLDRAINDTSYQVVNGVAVIPVHGPMFAVKPRIYEWLKVPATGTWNLRDKIVAASNDSRVRAIHFDFDTPGGSIEGLEEAALAIHETDKPTSGHTRGRMCSAGYYLGSQCDRLTASTSAEVGSLGAVVGYTDDSEFYKQMGLKKYVFATGKIKAEFRSGVELSEDGKAFLTSMVMEAGEDFKAAINRGPRKINLDKVFTGEWWSGKNAKKLGLVDEIVNGEVTMPKEDVDTSAIEAKIESLISTLASVATNVAAVGESVNGVTARLDAVEKKQSEASKLEQACAGRTSAERGQLRELAEKIGVDAAITAMDALGRGPELNTDPKTGATGLPENPPEDDGIDSGLKAELRKLGISDDEIEAAKKNNGGVI